MKEEQLLNKTLNLINDDDSLVAYNYLVSNLDLLEEKSSQVYNFLYCLAAISDKKDEAIDWLREDIDTKGLWYRPEVFEDEDLDSIREKEEFKKYVKKSKDKFLEAKSKAKTVFTWKSKEKDNIIIVLHGNQQNNEISKNYWSDLKASNYQLEYIQSNEVDSYQLYRWEDQGNGIIQLINSLASIDYEKYKDKVLSGFSSGCNTILRTLSETNIVCDRVVLISPWIPYIKNDLERLINNLIKKEVEVLIVCGKKDKDCYPLCRLFENKADKLGLKIKRFYIDDLDHQYPSNFLEIISKFLND